MGLVVGVGVANSGGGVNELHVPHNTGHVNAMNTSTHEELPPLHNEGGSENPLHVAAVVLPMVVNLVGREVGALVGVLVGCLVGALVGDRVGAVEVGTRVGDTVGDCVCTGVTVVVAFVVAADDVTIVVHVPHFAGHTTETPPVVQDCSAQNSGSGRPLQKVCDAVGIDVGDCVL